MIMDYYDENIAEIKKFGFINTYFPGFGATVYKRGNTETLIDEWGFARIRLLDNKTIHLGDLSKEPIKDKLDSAIRELTKTK